MVCDQKRLVIVVVFISAFFEFVIDLFLVTSYLRTNECDLVLFKLKASLYAATVSDQNVNKDFSVLILVRIT